MKDKFRPSQITPVTYSSFVSEFGFLDGGFFLYNMVPTSHDPCFLDRGRRSDPSVDVSCHGTVRRIRFVHSSARPSVRVECRR